MYEVWMDVLMKTELFKNIPENDLKSMVYCLSPMVKEYRKGELVAIEGHKIKGIGLLLKGNLTISKDVIDGTSLIMKKIESGDMFGEIAAFAEKEVWPATVTAHQDSHVMFIPSERIVGLCPTGCIGHKTLLNNMLRIVSNKAINLNEKIEYLSVRSIREKISKYLIAQYKQQKSTTLFLNMNRNEMADFLNVTRPSLSREMSYMKEEGLIDFHRSSVKILNLERISTYLN
ncbi:MAG: Crp/Fnr family transcriptional regulator [Dethiosulfatibacter sp.]|nr:Crp/Fnr family transcriptional regulator [Dethiosulfatibacter sp.]